MKADRKLYDEKKIQDLQNKIADIDIELRKIDTYLSNNNLATSMSLKSENVEKGEIVEWELKRDFDVYKSKS